MRRAGLCFLAYALGAQEPRFQTRTHEVLVPVSVMSKDGKPVEELTAADFVVLNDGKPQRVRMIARDLEAEPIYAVLVLQTSGSNEAALAKIRKTASVVSGYITNDMDRGTPSLAAVMAVADDVRITQDFTSDPNVLDDAFAKVSTAGDAGRLLDGVNTACDMLAARKEAARRVIILISESRDRQSKADFADVVAKAQRENVVIYTLSYSAYATAFTQKASDHPTPDQPGLYDPQSAGGANLLAIGMELARLAKINVAEALARSTGGSHGKFTTLSGLETQLTAVGHEIHNRYLLTFVPPKEQVAGYHRLAVSVHKPGDYRVRARAGYWATLE